MVDPGPGGRRDRGRRRAIQAPPGRAGRRQDDGRSGFAGGAASRPARRAQGPPVNISAPFIKRPIAHLADRRGDPAGRHRRLFRLPVAPLPQVDFPTIQVSASLPGASPETMASNVATAAGAAVLADPRRSQMTSVSALGSTQHHAAVRPRRATSTPPRRTCRRRSTPPAASCRPTCPARRPSARSTRPTRRS